MKQKLSVTIDEKTINSIVENVKNGRYRNKSHAVENSINKLNENKNE